MTRRLLLSYLGITAIVIAALGLPLAIAYQHDVQHDRTTQVQAGAAALATLVDDSAEGSISVTAPVLAAHYGEQLRAQIIVLDATHATVADTGDGPLAPFVSAIQHSPNGQITSGSAGGQLYVIASTVSGGRVLAVYPPVGVNGAVRRYWLMIGLFAAGAMLVALLVGVLLARSLTRPLRALEQATAAVGEGRLSAVPEEGPPEVRSLARTFNETTRRLNRLLKAQAAWVSDASHELRTPLAAMRLRLENAQAASPKDDDIAAALDDVERLTRLTDALLALGRADADAGETASIAIERVVADRIALWAPLAADEQLDLVAEVAGRPVAAASGGTVEQALDNLLANAFAAAPAGSTIVVSAAAIGAYVELHVIDQGPGLTSDERARAFDRFWRGGSAKPGAGSGLGLAIVRGLVERDRGSVELEQATGGGIDAVIRLPRAER